jgi:hypothetical protein
VYVAHRLVILLLFSVPVLVFVESSIALGVACALTSAAIAKIAFSIGPEEASHLWRVLRTVAIALTIPALGIPIQAVQISSSPLIHPIWPSAAKALNDAALGRISIDPGATIVSWVQFCCATGILFAAAAIAIDRRRAESVLFALTLVAGAASTTLVFNEWGALRALGIDSSALTNSALSTISIIGTVVAIAAATRALERYETRRSTAEAAFGQFIIRFVTCLAATATCWLAISGQAQQIFAAACGTTTFVLIAIIRRVGTGRSVSVSLATGALIVAAAVAANESANRGDFSLRFALSSPGSTVSMTDQMIADTRWTGSGAGTFSALASVYRDIDDPAAPRAPTTAAAIIVELGRPALLLAIAMIVLSTAQLAAGALTRGRDSFYAAAASGCAVALLIAAFVDANLLSLAAQIFIAVVIGLGIAQRRSRAPQ